MYSWTLNANALLCDDDCQLPVMPYKALASHRFDLCICISSVLDYLVAVGCFYGRCRVSHVSGNHISFTHLDAWSAFCSEQGEAVVDFFFFFPS